MGTSYQDIDTRLEGVENALMFLMQDFFKVQTEVPGSGLSLDGRPRVETKTLYQVYMEALARGLASRAVADLTPDDVVAVVNEDASGTDTE